ncbi:helix-turn-helix domain-containing protein [Bradyrhizobium japonicum]|uniref:helix-turn-helix domain-containing protein n=1 Tax=Bradyrhizobium japonicum TaxID=375 RepID=UPI00200E14DA|nr:helix-turn-helix domain-containing protein [Bradyrhizobium japonicum]
MRCRSAHRGGRLPCHHRDDDDPQCVAGRYRATDQEYDRTPAHVARGAMDHFQITLCVEGEMRFSSGRREVTMGPGAICLIDMAQPNRTVLRGGGSRTRLMAIILQRAMLAPRLAHPDSATATLLPSNHPHTRLLASHYAALTLPPSPRRAAPRPRLKRSPTSLPRPPADRRHCGRSRTRRAASLSCDDQAPHRDNIETDALTADELCRHFQISRATLYRLFEADGGLSHYVREQRLNLAFRQLISPSAEDTRLIDLAVGMRFSSDSTFIRAFRRKFGLTPGELRELADNWLRETGAVPTIDTVLHQLARRRTS